MPQILLATYNFYPYNWGGSEVYVAGLAQYLQQAGQDVRLIAAVPDQAFAEHGVWWSGTCLRVCRYTHEGLSVYGVQHPVDTTGIYRKYHPDWERDWRDFFAFLQQEEQWTPSLLHLHGFTAVIGLALVKACRQDFPQAPVHASYHTPLSCPKGDLLRWGKTECNIQANIRDCSACTWQAKTQWPIATVRLSQAILPPFHFKALPTALRWKHLIGSAVQGFQELTSLVDQWWVFSSQIQAILAAQRVPLAKIRMGRHGVAAAFIPVGLPQRTNKPIVFAFVGRFKKIKGLNTLLQAWEKLPETPCRELWLVGDVSTADAEIQEGLNRLGSRRDVKILGQKNSTELVAIYTQIHTLVVPSECLEIGPLVMHESIAGGANVIASSIGGTRELAAHYASVCKVFPMGNPEVLREQIEQFEYQPARPLVVDDQTHYAQVFQWYPKNQIKPQAH